MQLYTIGFTQKSAETFFSSLKAAGVTCLVDIRLNPQGQLAGFARKEDLPYFLDQLAGGCSYVHLPILNPTKELMEGFREDHDWERYRARFEALMDQRDIPNALDRSLFESNTCCLLCSEATPEHCHRRLIVERLAKVWQNIEIIHL